MGKRYTKQFLLLFLFCLIGVLKSNAQILEGMDAEKIVKGSEIVRINPNTNKIQYVLFRQSFSIGADDAQFYVQKLLGLNSDYGFTQIRKEEDELGFTHIRLQETYRGIEVLGAVMILHIKDHRLHSFNGEAFEIKEAAAIELSEKACLKIAMDTTAALSYMWQHPEEELAIKQIKEDENATWFPSGKLMYAPVDLDFTKNEFKLTYKFNLHAFEPRTAENIYISVADGKIVARENQLHTTDVNGLAYTKYSGQKTIQTDSTAPFNYRLRESTRGNGIYTFNLKKSTNYGTAVDFTDSNNIWNNVNANKDEVATDCHWGAATTYDYYKFRHNRNSYNNANARINSYVHYSNNYDNAFWDGIRMTYGDGSSFKPLTSLDVCGHEITHAVTSNSANLIYSNESGQLNESFSDIFGNAVERYGKPSGYSWIIGEEITYDGTGLRNMLNPKIKGQPRCYKSTNWYFGTADNGGVHYNSGVQNWWFYLISEGGSGTNDVSNVYNVDSLGILKAEKIAYRNLTVYLTPSSQHTDARFYSIRSAVDLYGNCSKEVIAVTNAWYACNVGAKYDSGYVKAGFIADSVVCKGNKLVNFTNLSTNANSCKWYFGDATTSTVYNATHTYNTYGAFTIKLVANSCFLNKKDSLIKTAYVKIDSTYDICNAVLMPMNGTDSTHKCESFVYDDGGEDIYTQNKITYFRISVPGSDTIRINFSVFDYELNYDSLYIYKGIYPGTGTKIGGYTGSTLPALGNFIDVPGSIVTLRHVSDPYVVGNGFKLKYKALRKPLDVKAFSDTSICKGRQVLLIAKGTGGYFKDYHFYWKNIVYNDSVIVKPDSTQLYKVVLTDVCSKVKDSATALVTVLPALDIQVGKDTVICKGQSVRLIPKVTGGKSGSYTLTWNNGLGTGTNKLLSPVTTTTYRIILSDGCTPVNDTAYYTIRVKDGLKVDLKTNDSIICFNKMSQLTASASGGDTLKYNFNWSHGAGNMNSQNVLLNASTWVKVTLSDACSSPDAVDSVFVTVRPQLSLNLKNDTLICRGTSVLLSGQISGGDNKKYKYTWTQGLPDTSKFTVRPVVKTTYKLTLTDNCSDPVADSMVVDVMAPIVVSGMFDTTICNGQSVFLKPIVTGGIKSKYTYNWNFGLSSTDTHTVSPSGFSNYRVIVNDGCTVLGDTGFSKISVRSVLRPEISTIDTLICYGKKVDLTVSGLGGISANYLYTWNMGLGTGTSKSINLTKSGYVKAILTDACTVEPGVDSVYIEVRPELKLNLGNDTAICSGTSMQLMSNAKGGDKDQYAYTWNQGLSSQANQTVAPSVKTTYIVNLVDNCSDPYADTILVDVLKPLKVSGLRDTTICSGASVDLNPIFSGGVTADYVSTWSDIGIGSSRTVSPIADVVYSIDLKDNCSVPSAGSTVKVSVLQPLKLSTTLSKNEICSGDSGELNIVMSGGKSSQYVWTLNSIAQTQTKLILKPNIKTDYIVKLDDNCSSPVSDTLSIVVNALPIINFTVDADSICLPGVVQFTNTSGGASKYLWDFGDGDTSASNQPLHKYDNLGTFDVNLKAISNKGCLSELNKLDMVTVVPHPKARFTYTPDQPDYLNTEVTFKNNSIAFDRFKWNFGDLQTDELNLNANHKYADTGVYPMFLMVSNSLGCADTMSLMLKVKDVFILNIPNAITVNNDNINETFVVKGRGIQHYRLQVFNRWGEMVYDGDHLSPEFDGKAKDGTPLMKGTYMVVLTVRDFGGFMHYIREMVEIL